MENKAAPVLQFGAEFPFQAQQNVAFGTSMVNRDCPLWLRDRLIQKSPSRLTQRLRKPERKASIAQLSIELQGVGIESHNFQLDILGTFLFCISLGGRH